MRQLVCVRVAQRQFGLKKQVAHFPTNLVDAIFARDRHSESSVHGVIEIIEKVVVEWITCFAIQRAVHSAGSVINVLIEVFAYALSVRLVGVRIDL